MAAAPAPTPPDLVDAIYDAALQSDARFTEILARVAKHAGVIACGIKTEYVRTASMSQHWFGLPEGFEPGMREARLVESLVPRLARANRLREAASTLRLRSSAAAIDPRHGQDPFATFVVDEDLKPIETNTRGDRMLRAQGSLRSTSAGLTTLEPCATRLLRNAARRCIRDRCASEGAFVSIPGVDGTPVLVIVQPRVAQGLSLGNTPAEIATQRGLSITTIRSQLRAVLQKTGSDRQTDLVRMLTTIALAESGG